MSITKVGIVSDTHGTMTSNIAQHLNDCDVVIHAGDYKNPMHVEQLACCGNKLATVYAVRGNCDWGSDYPAELVFVIDDVRFFLTHGHRFLHRADAWDIAIAQGSALTGLGIEPCRPDVVIFGHLHNTMRFTHHGVLFINPGSPTKPRSGSVASICTLTIESGTVKDVEFLAI